jgi:hypothetical protein
MDPVSTGNRVHAHRKYCFNRVFPGIKRLKSRLILQNSGLPAAGFLGSMEWSSEPEICQPVQSVSVSQIYDGEIYHNDAVSMVTPDKKTLLGAKAPAARASPRLAIALYYLYSCMLRIQVSMSASHVRPVPLGGLVAQEGGASSKKTGTNRPAPVFSCKIPISSKLFPAIFIFVRKNSAARTFARNFFGFFNFQTGKNPAGEVSFQNFLRFSTFNRKFFWFFKFRGKKKSVFSDSGAGSVSQDLRRRSELVA